MNRVTIIHSIKKQTSIILKSLIKGKKHLFTRELKNHPQKNPSKRYLQTKTNYCICDTYLATRAFLSQFFAIFIFIFIFFSFFFFPSPPILFAFY